jgi:hypothetical protein
MVAMVETVQEAQQVVAQPAAPQQVPQTKEQMILNAFNDTLRLVVRELNLLYGNVSAVISSAGQQPQA